MLRLTIRIKGKNEIVDRYGSRINKIADILDLDAKKVNCINEVVQKLKSQFQITLRIHPEENISSYKIDHKNIKISENVLEEELSKNVEVKQTLDTGTSKYPISYKLRKSKDGWKIVNIIINGVNLGLTFRNQFQALAVSHNENISDTLRNWVSDAGTAGIT